MAEILICNYTAELIAAIRDRIQEVSDQCLGKEIIDNEVHGQMQSTDIDAAERARTLLMAVENAIVVNQTLFEDVMDILRNVVFPAPDSVPQFMKEMEKQYRDLMILLCDSGDRKRKRTDSEPTEMDQELAATLKARKLIAGNEPETISRARIIEMFTPEVIPAISSSIAALSDQCLSKGLICSKTYRRLHEMTIYGEQNRARSLLIEVMKSIQNDDRCFDIFLKILIDTLPTAVGSKLVADIVKEFENYILVPSANADSPCHQASEVKDDSHDVHAKYQEAIANLRKANREKEDLEKELEKRIEKNEKLKEDLFRAEGHEKEELKEKIAECEHEIRDLRETIEFKEKEVENCHMKLRRERELFQEERRLAGEIYKDELHSDAKKLEEEMRENLKLGNQDLKQKIEKLQQEIAGFGEENTTLMQEKNALQETTNKISQENQSLLSELHKLNEDW